MTDAKDVEKVMLALVEKGYRIIAPDGKDLTGLLEVRATEIRMEEDTVETWEDVGKKLRGQPQVTGQTEERFG